MAVFDIEARANTWTAKNVCIPFRFSPCWCLHSPDAHIPQVAPDKLQLRVPVWIRDLQFYHAEPHKLMVGTSYHQLRVYDTKAQRRPVLDLSLAEFKSPFTSLALSADNT